LSILTNLKDITNRLAGRFHVPSGLLYSREEKILHISDTPTTLYPAIKYLLETLKPDVLVHTGDLADDIKLEIDPGYMDAYGRAVIPFLRMMEDSPAGEIYVVPGNHDSPEVIDRNTRRTRLVTEGDVLLVKGMSLGMAHTPARLPETAGFRLYGHNFSGGTGNNAVYLNGLRNVNVILCPSGRVVKIFYPFTVNYDRKLDNCYGIARTV